MKYKIDLHNHTTLSSQCSVLDVRDLIRLSKEAGLDAICVTEHNTMYGARRAVTIGAEMGFTVIAGQEIASASGDILAFGVEDEGLQGIPVAELCALAKKRGGALIPAHPFRTGAFSLGDTAAEYAGCFAALEGMNGNCSDEQNRRAAELAMELGLPVTGGSDAHSIQMVAKYYTVFDTEFPIIDTRGLILALKSGQYTAVKAGERSTV
ncbi:MAG: PHP domain-containing protein [Brevinematales bacterium]|nr:PHP domain-containing protein [Brevinematales bacterium]